MKRTYKTPKIRIHKLCLDSMMTMIEWSGYQYREGFAKKQTMLIDDEEDEY